jgi:hypothetical protein
MKTSGFVGIAVVVGCVLGLPAAKSEAAQIQVGQCPIGGACIFGGPTPWSDALSLAQLTSLGLDTDVPLVAAQTAGGIMRLGITTADFTVSGGPDVIDTLPEFSGAAHGDLPPFETDTVGSFFIPFDAIG